MKILNTAREVLFSPFPPPFLLQKNLMIFTQCKVNEPFFFDVLDRMLIFLDLIHFFKKIIKCISTQDLQKLLPAIIIFLKNQNIYFEGYQVYSETTSS